MLKIAIVEDDKAEASRLKKLIEIYSARKGKQISCFVYSNGLDFLDNIKQPYDIVFMDIEMPMMDGLQVAKKFRESDASACLMFVTRMAQLAIKGYEVNAMDFLVKPIKNIEFEIKLDRAFSYCDSLPKDNIAIEEKGAFQFVHIKDILYVEVFEHDILIHTTDKVYKTRGALAKYKNDLSKYNFERCARPFLVNLRHIMAYKQSKIVLTNGETLQVGRTYRKTFLDVLSRYLVGILK